MPEELNTQDKVTPTESKNEDKGGAGDDKSVKTYTQEELQAEADRIAAKTRDEEKKKSDKAIEAAKKAAREEAIAETKLSAEEKAKKEREDADKAQAQREQELTLRENKADAKEKFAELNLPIKLADFFVVTDKEAMMSGIDTFKKAWDEAIKVAVTEQLKGKTQVDVKNGDDKSTQTPIDQIPNFV